MCVGLHATILLFHCLLYFSSTENSFPRRAIKKALYSASGDDPESKLHNMGDWVYALRPRPRYKSFLKWLYPRPEKDALLETARFAAVCKGARRYFLFRLVFYFLPVLGGGGAMLYYWFGTEFVADPITGTSAALRLELQAGIPPMLIQLLALGLVVGGTTRVGWAWCECTASRYVDRWHPCMTNAAVVHNVILTKTRFGFSLLFLLTCPAVGTLLRIYPCLYSASSVGVGLGVTVFALMMAVPYVLTVLLLKCVTFDGDGAVRALFLPALQPHVFLAASAIVMAAPSALWWHEELYQGIWNRTATGLDVDEIYCTTYFNLSGAGFYDRQRYGDVVLSLPIASTSSSGSRLYSPFTPADARLVRCPATAIGHWPLRSFDVGPHYLYSYAKSTGYYDYRQGAKIANIEAGREDSSSYTVAVTDEEIEELAQERAVQWRVAHNESRSVPMEMLRLNATLSLKASKREEAMSATTLVLHPSKPWTNLVLNQPSEFAFLDVKYEGGGAGLVHTPAVCGGVGGLVELCLALVLLPLLLGVPIAVAGLCSDTKVVAQGRWRRPQKLGAHGRMVGLDASVGGGLGLALDGNSAKSSGRVGVKTQSAWVCLRVCSRVGAKLAAVRCWVERTFMCYAKLLVEKVFGRSTIDEDEQLAEVVWREQLKRMRHERPAVNYFPPHSRTEAALLREKMRQAAREVEAANVAAMNAKSASTSGKASGGALGNKARAIAKVVGAMGSGGQGGAVASTKPVGCRRRRWRWEHWDSDEEGSGDHEGEGREEQRANKKGKTKKRGKDGGDDGGEGFIPHLGGSSLFLRMIKFPFKDKYTTITFYGWDGASITPLLEPLRASAPGYWPALDLTKRLLLCLLAVGLHPAPTEIAQSPPVSVSPYALSDGVRLQLCALCLALHLTALVLVQPYSNGANQAVSVLCCAASLLHALYGIALAPPEEVWHVLHPLLSAEKAWGGVSSSLTQSAGIAIQALLMLVMVVAAASLVPPVRAMRAAAAEARRKALAIKDLQVQWSQRKRELHGTKVLPGVAGDARFMSVHRSTVKDMEMVSSFLFMQAKCGRLDMLQYWDECVVPSVPYGWRIKPENMSYAAAAAVATKLRAEAAAGESDAENLAKHKFANCFVPVAVILAGKRLGANVLTLQSYPSVGGIIGFVAGGHCGGVSLLHCAIAAHEPAVVRWLIKKDVELHRYFHHLRVKEQHRCSMQGGAIAVPIPEGDREYVSAFQSAADENGRCALMATVEGACDEWATANRFAVDGRKGEMEELLANDFGLIIHEKHRLEGTYDFQANLSADPHAAQHTKFKRRRKVWKKPMVLPDSLGKKMERNKYNKYMSKEEMTRLEHERLAKEEKQIHEMEVADEEEQRQELEAYYDKETRCCVAYITC
jgi:hypothetical protein